MLMLPALLLARKRSQNDPHYVLARCKQSAETKSRALKGRFLHVTAVGTINTALALPLLALGLQELPELQIRSPFKRHVLVPRREKKTWQREFWEFAKGSWKRKWLQFLVGDVQCSCVALSTKPRLSGEEAGRHGGWWGVSMALCSGRMLQPQRKAVEILIRQAFVALCGNQRYALLVERSASKIVATFIIAAPLEIWRWKTMHSQWVHLEGPKHVLQVQMRQQAWE